MTIYLGDNGHVELQRQGATDSSLERAAFHTAIEADDVNVDARRFSFTGASLSLITGDKVEIERVATPPEDLELIEGRDFPDWLGYVHVDAIGGIRLYDDFAAAIEGSKDLSLIHI